MGWLGVISSDTLGNDPSRSNDCDSNGTRLGKGWVVEEQDGNRRRWRGELWDGGLLREIRETRHKTGQDDCVGVDGCSIVWTAEVKQFRPDK